MSDVTEQLQKMKTQPGFIAALDQSGGSTPGALRAYGIQDTAWSSEAQMFEIVHQMQEQLYEEAPYIVTAETGIGEAVRNDRFACFQPQPDPDGVWLVQYGARNYTLLRPADEAGDCDGVTSALGAAEERVA